MSDIIKDYHELVESNSVAYVFDLDNTLIDTTAVVKIKDIKTNKTFTYGAQSYNHLSFDGVSCDCIVDFSEFDSFTKLMEEPIKLEIFEILRSKSIEDGVKVYILTSRMNKEIIQQWLYSYKISNVEVLTREPRFPNISAVEFKYKKMEDIIQYYDKVFWYEDDVKVIHHLKTNSQLKASLKKLTINIPG